MRGGVVGWIAGALFGLSLNGCAAGADAPSLLSAAVTCTPMQALSCMCPDGTAAVTQCLTSGQGFEPCPCAGVSSMPGTGGTAPLGTGGSGGQDASGDGSVDLMALRGVCADTINMYRAMLSLPPLQRALAADEACSDIGAKIDADSSQTQSSKGMCAGFSGQTSCPGWSVGGGSGNATLDDALAHCIDAMWAKGPPSTTREQCVADATGCYAQYAYYLELTDPNYHVVSCGFYKMPNGKWWINQDFGM